MLSAYISDPEHPMATQKGLIRRDRAVLYAKIGPGDHPCHVCDRTITWMKGASLAADAIHLDVLDDMKSRFDPDNVAPICINCIRRRHHYQAIKDGEVVFVNKHGRRSRGTEKTCERCSMRFVVETSNMRSNPKVGRFCSGSCRSKTVNEARWAKARTK